MKILRFVLIIISVSILTSCRPYWIVIVTEYPRVSIKEINTKNDSIELSLDIVFNPNYLKGEFIYEFKPFLFNGYDTINLPNKMFYGENFESREDIVTYKYSSKHSYKTTIPVTDTIIIWHEDEAIHGYSNRRLSLETEHILKLTN